jgi:hypothetical protein
MVACDPADPRDRAEMVRICRKWKRHPLGDVFQELFVVCMEDEDGKQGRVEQDL